MNYNDPRFRRHLSNVLGESYKFSSHFGSAFSRISGKTDELESVVLLNVIMDQSKDGGTLEHQVNELFMMAKLHYADEINTRRTSILNAVAARMEEEILEEKRKAERLRVAAEAKQRQLDRKEERSKSLGHEYDYQRSKAIAKQQGGIGDNPTENRKHFGTYVPLRDSLLTLIDKIRSGTCTVLDENELGLMQVLEDVHKLKLVSKGWLVKTIQFEDDKLAQAVRAIIVAGR